MEQVLTLEQNQEPSVTLEEIMRDAWQIAEDKGWHEDRPDQPKKSFVEELMLAVTEISEAVEEYRNRRGYTEIYYSSEGKPEGIPIEMADVCVRLFDTCITHGIDLEGAIIEKMQYNRTRKHRHGGRRI